MNRPLLERGTLAPTLAERSRHAIASGAMRPIRTREEVVRDAGVEFIVRQVSSLERKAILSDAAGTGNAQANPFLPHEPDLFVAEVSDTHFALLNKFNVIERHLLIITRTFVHQEMLLDEADFEALAACMAEVDGLGFYNGGAVAGASQPHKHLQLVPLPLGAVGPPLPVEALFEQLRSRAGPLRVPALPFRHALMWFEDGLFDDVATAARRMHACYLELLGANGLRVPDEGDSRQSAPYNVLATRRWMLLVPRSRERYESIAVNALGYAGSMFVRDDAQRALLKRIGPMSVLRGTALAAV